jgi:hypothetical protein
VRRVPPKWWLRLLSGWRAGLAFALPALAMWFGVRATVASYVKIPVWITVVVPICCILLGIVIAWICGSIKMLPDAFVDEVGSDAPFKSVLAISDSLREACELTRPHYGREFVGHELAEQWRLANPRAFECIFNRRNELCASFGLLPPSNSFMDLFVDGRIKDLQLKEKDILAGAAAKKCGRLYISGVVVRDPEKMPGHKRARVMLWVMLQHLKREYGLKKRRELYAIAVTKESETLMRNLKFELAANGKNREDKCPLYRYELTRETWNNLLQEVGDCSGICTILPLKTGG